MLRPYLEHYWLIDWDLDAPYASHVVPHPSVNVVFQNMPGQEYFAEAAGPRHELFTQKLDGRGHVCGVQFRPGGFRPFSPASPVSRWADRQVPLREAMPVRQADIDAVLRPEGEDERVAALDAYLSDALAAASEPERLRSGRPESERVRPERAGAGRAGSDSGRAPDSVPAPARGPHARGAAQAMALVDLVRRDRAMRRVDRLAAAGGLSVRSLQRLFADYVGVSPKWVVLRYRIHEALERAEEEPLDWARLADQLGYSDQAHLVRDFTTTVGVPPTLYARGM